MCQVIKRIKTEKECLLAKTMLRILDDYGFARIGYDGEHHYAAAKHDAREIKFLDSDVEDGTLLVMLTENLTR